MVYYVSASNKELGDGTKENPFRTISQAAEIASAGDTIVIGNGVYREWVCPARGGLSETQRIVYTAEEHSNPVISGAEIVHGWQDRGGGIWSVILGKDFFGEYNSLTDELFGDWYDSFGQVHHTGELYLNGSAMYEVPSYEALIEKMKNSERSLRWLAENDGDRTVLSANFGCVNPNCECTEISIRPFCFFPKKEGINYITVSGITLCKAATQWAPPTAFQAGIIGVNWSKGWIIENCTVYNSKCVGISLGKRREEEDNIWSRDPSKDGSQTYTELIFKNLQNGWSKDNVGGHTVRNNHIYNCGQAGIAGCMGGAFSVIENNHIHNVNIRGEFGGAEMAGIKLHGAIDAVIENNCIHDCIRGLWLDWEAQGTAVRRNSFFQNRSEDLFIEVSHGPCTVENNIFLSPCNFLNVSQGTALVHNLFAGEIKIISDTNRFTLYHLPHTTMVGGVSHIFSGDDKIVSNIFIGGKNNVGTDVYNGFRSVDDKCKNEKFIFAQKIKRKFKGDLLAHRGHLAVKISSNIYLNGASAYKCETGAYIIKKKVKFELKQENGHFFFETDMFDLFSDFSVEQVTGDFLGKSFESGQKYENSDGSVLKIDKDFFGKERSEKTFPGPFAELKNRIKLI